MSPAARRLIAAAAVLWMAVIFGLSSLSGSSVPEGPPALGHFMLYAVLGALYYLALPDGARAWRIVLAIGLASLYGVSDEFHQSFVPGRTPDVMDWLVDTAGAALAVLAVRAGISRFRFAPQPPAKRRADGP